MSRAKKASAELVRERRSGMWIVKISMPDGFANYARQGSTQRIVYDSPERVPTHLRTKIVPDLMREAIARNLRGE